MAVYVDAARLTADTLGELHTFAMKLGVARTSYRHNHHCKAQCYYDLSEGARAQAIQQGACVKSSASPEKGDWVAVDGYSMVGYVQRVARDGSWADVHWGTHTKRMQTRVLQVQATIQRGEWKVTDITRENELNGAPS